MNRSVCFAWVFVSIFAFVGPVRGQSAVPVAPLGPQVLNAPQPNTSAIQKFVDDQVARLKGVAIEQQRAGRSALVASCPRGLQPLYYTIYGRQFMADATPFYDTTPSLRQRLELAIVLAAIAQNGQSLEMEPLVEKMLADKESPVALWAMKAAAPMVPIELQSPGSARTTKLMADMVACVKAHPDRELAGYLATDAYNAMVISSIPGVQNFKPLLPPLYDPILDLFEYRVSTLATGLTPAPGAERGLTTFLSTSYADMSPTQQKRAVQGLVNFISGGGQRAGLAVKKDEAPLKDTLKYAGQALVIISGNNSVVIKATSSLTGIAPGSPVATLEAACRTASTVSALKTVWPFLLEPPTLPTIAPTTP